MYLISYNSGRRQSSDRGILKRSYNFGGSIKCCDSSMG